MYEKAVSHSWVNVFLRDFRKQNFTTVTAALFFVHPAGFSFQLTSAVLLSILVFLPSIIVVILMLVRLGRKSGVLKEKKKSGCKKSSIEVSDE